MAVRASTTARGYGNEHQAERRRWQRKLDRSQAEQCSCPGNCGRHSGRCVVVIDKDTPSDAWDLGHRPGQQGYAGPQCRHCNRAAGALSGHKARRMTLRPF